MSGWVTGESWSMGFAWDRDEKRIVAYRDGVEVEGDEAAEIVGSFAGALGPEVFEIGLRYMMGDDAPPEDAA